MKYHNIPTLFDNQASLINGKNIGTDSVRYIQDAGQKTAGTTYIDKNTNELYVCVTTTNSVNNDSNFSKFNLKEAFNKLDSFDEKNSEIIKIRYLNVLSSLYQLRYLKTGLYYISAVVSNEDFFKEFVNTDKGTQSILKIFRFPNGGAYDDTWIQFVNWNQNVYEGFLNNNGQIAPLRLVRRGYV